MNHPLKVIIGSNVVSQFETNTRISISFRSIRKEIRENPFFDRSSLQVIRFQNKMYEDQVIRMLYTGEIKLADLLMAQ